MKRHTTLFAFLGLALLLVSLGCDAAQPDDDATPSASADVAASVSSLLSEDAGGLMDQVGDLFDLAGAGDLGALPASKQAGPASPVEKTYDAATGTWTISVTRAYTSGDGLRHATFSRVYEVRFLNASGQPQQFFVTAGDTARSIAFTIVEGGGTVETPHLSAARSAITGAFTADGVHTDEVTINGTYSRSGAHTLTTANAVRTLDYTLSVEVIDLVGPRGSRRDLSQKISGVINGTYAGHVTVERGALYRERDVDRAVSITIQNGTATITVNGDAYESDVQTGTVAAR